MSSQSVPHARGHSAESALWSSGRVPRRGSRGKRRQCERSSLRLEAQAAGGQREGVGFAQHDAVSQQLKKDIVVAAEDKAQRQSVVPALGAQQRVQLVQDHAGLDPDQQVQDPQRFVEKKLQRGHRGETV